MSAIEPGYSLLTLIFAFLIGLLIGRITAGGNRSARHENEAQTNQSEIQRSAAETAALLSPELRAEVEALLAQDRKIEAIRVIRAALGFGLKEAKDLADLIEQGHPRGGARAP
jgi:ribosomal protein L7/L12